MPHYRSKATTLKTRRIAGGFSIGDLAKRAGVSDFLIVNLESNGGTAQATELQLVANALASAVIVSSSVANPSQITTSTPHGFISGETATIGGHTGSTPAID